LGSDPAPVALATDADQEALRMFFDSWTGLGRVLLVGALAYAALILILRISGKRTLTKLNAFDLVVTVALGSTLATTLLTDYGALRHVQGHPDSGGAAGPGGEG
ncbi:MAG TPA: hypothetical protein VMK65_09445, partial [Longimicrobiales bacterium]|nr:hypothetical protein [Longimicrobiales bacterium]